MKIHTHHLRRKYSDRILTHILKWVGTVLCIPCALPLPWNIRLNYSKFLHRVFYRDLKGELSWFFSKYLELVVVDQNEKHGIGKNLGEYLERAQFDDTSQRQTWTGGIKLKDIMVFINAHFPPPEIESLKTSVQFTGGKDSMLAAVAASSFHHGEIHLLFFRHALIEEVERINQNIKFLSNIFGQRYQLILIDIEGLIKEIYLQNYWNDLRKYKLEIAGLFCGSCRLAMHAANIKYCLKNKINVAYDGANKTGFDLSQRQWFVNRLKDFYKEFGIIYATPVMGVRRSDNILQEIFGGEIRGSQPECMGGGETHNVFWRCHSLDKYGKEKHETILKEWTDERLEILKDYISRS